MKGTPVGATYDGIFFNFFWGGCKHGWPTPTVAEARWPLLGFFLIFSGGQAVRGPVSSSRKQSLPLIAEAFEKKMPPDPPRSHHADELWEGINTVTST